jgi:hypothetical protein
MPGLGLTAPQAAIIADLDTALDTALAGGVNNAVPAQIIAALNLYTTYTSTQKSEVRAFFELVVAAFLVAQKIPAEFPSSTFTGTAVLAKVTGGGSNGSLTFVNGICTAYTPPS